MTNADLAVWSVPAVIWSLVAVKHVRQWIDDSPRIVPSPPIHPVPEPHPDAT